MSFLLRPRFLLYLPLCLALALTSASLVPSSARAADSAPALPAALNPEALGAARLQPGTTVELDPGRIPTTGYLLLENIHGTAEKPVILRARQRGQTVITGRAGFSLKNCEHVTLEGFTFENDANQHAVLLTGCRHVRITRCTFRLDEKPKPRWSQHWVYILGTGSHHNRVDHCLFEKQSQKGSMVFARGDDTTLTPSQHDRIDHNHFRDVLYAQDNNGHETLRTGSNDMGAAGKSTFTSIEHNLLERCSGEQEIVSLKSSGNIVRHNTFVDCRGSICLRLGNRSEITGNIMLNPGGLAGTGGVKVYGFEHKITGNRFEDLTGTGHEAPLALIPGPLDAESTDQIGKLYQDLTTAPATRAVISGNTWVNCAPLLFGQDKPDKERRFLPNHISFSGNTLAHTRPVKDKNGKPAPLLHLGHATDISASGNTAHLPADSPAPGKSWASWFSLSPTPPGLPAPQPLNAADVGPDAQE